MVVGGTTGLAAGRGRPGVSMARKSRKESPGLLDQLREQIRDEVASGRTLTALARDASVDLPRLSRFYRGERGLSQEALDRVFRTLGLQVVKLKKPKK